MTSHIYECHTFLFFPYILFLSNCWLVQHYCFVFFSGQLSCPSQTSDTQPPLPHTPVFRMVIVQSILISCDTLGVALSRAQQTAIINYLYR